jgi:kynurenine formamidase
MTSTSDGLNGIGQTVDQVELPRELREAAKEVSNWGKWGDADELGTLNYITPDILSRAAKLVRRGKTVSLSIPFDAYGPQGAHGFRRNPVHLMTLDGGDSEMARRLGGWGGQTEAQIGRLSGGPMRFNDDYIMMPLQAATQWDALSHVYYDQRLYNGYPADSVTSLGATRDSIDKVAAGGRVAGRGVLLDIARSKGVRHLAEGAIVVADDLEAAADAQGVEVQEGDIILVRTGWRLRFLEDGDGERWARTSPGLDWRCAKWLNDKRVAAVASDNIAVETSTSEFPGVSLPLHMLTLRDMGMMLGEIWDLELLAEECRNDAIYDFLLVAQPLLITGAVGSPINPVAIR